MKHKSIPTNKLIQRWIALPRWIRWLITIIAFLFMYKMILLPTINYAYISYHRATKPQAISLKGMNYTGRFITNFGVKVNDQIKLGGGELQNNTDGGGGGSACCIYLPKDTKNFEIVWFEEDVIENKNAHPQVHKYSKMISVPPIPVTKQREIVLGIHFYPKQIVELEFTTDILGPEPRLQPLAVKSGE